MAANVNLWFFTILQAFLISLAADYFLPLAAIDDCISGTDSGYNLFFDFAQMKCSRCSQTSIFQTVSASGLSCVCQPGYKYIRQFDGQNIQCQACAADEVTSEDGWNCIKCASDNPQVSATRQCESCAARFVPVERFIDGGWNVDPLNGTLNECRPCQENTTLFGDGFRCTRCSQVLSMLPDQVDCQCPAVQMSGGMCFSNPSDIVPDSTNMYTIPVQNDVASYFFRQHLRAAHGMCMPPYSNVTACQVLGNMCVLLYYTRTSPNSGVRQACSLYEEVSLLAGGGRLQDWPPNLPWLYYVADSADIILGKTDIPVVYTFNPASYLQFKVAKYSIDGTYLGIFDVTGGEIQLCSDSETRLDAAYLFGTEYSHTCSFPSLNLWDKEKYPTDFYDLYMEYELNGAKQLYAIPVLMSDYKDTSGNYANNQGQSSWQLVRRFFLVDNIATIGSDSSGAPTQHALVARYASSMTFVISLKPDTTTGTIYPPYLRITYGEVTRSSAEDGGSISPTFKVEYSMDQSSYVQDFQIATGTLSVLGAIYAVYRTWVWSKRAGRMAIDFMTLISMIFFLAGALANVFFIIIFGISFYWLIFFKRQDAVYLVHPSGEAQSNFNALFITAFVLKLFHVIYLIFMQSTVDIFFIDWERSRGTVNSTAEENKKSQENPVSIWRTYFVANEWNEIQTMRKINTVFQLFAVVLFLVVLGFENVATMDPDGRLSKEESRYKAEVSNEFRFAIASLTYILVGFVQWIFFTFIYERFVEDKVQQFVDLCSMSNISVFIMAHYQYGYYIHGRSVHGRADTNMKEMHEMMKREEEALCGQRGLLSNTDNQTFQMLLPNRLRVKYDQVYLPITLQEGVQGAQRMDQARAGRIAGTPIEKSIQAYATINKFLCAYIDHSLRDSDYTVMDKTFMEGLLDTEFLDATEKGIFYNDNGHSFDRVLFYGNELTLFIFDVLFFCLIDLFAQNFVLAGILTYGMSQLIIIIRDETGRKNLARKTLVDKRFLI